MSKQKQYLKQIQQMITRYKKSGHAVTSLDKMMKGKTPEDFARNIKTFTEFKKVIKRARERKSILEESRQITNRIRQERLTKTTSGRLGELYRLAQQTSKQMVKEAETQVGRKSLIRFKTQFRDRFPQFTDWTKIKSEDRMMELIYEMHTTSIVDVGKEITREQLDDFLHKYFMEVTENYGVEERLDKLIEHFGGDLNKMTQFVNYVTQPQFTGEYDSESGKEDPESYNQEMMNRLAKMESVLMTNKRFRNRK